MSRYSSDSDSSSYHRKSRRKRSSSSSSSNSSRRRRSKGSKHRSTSRYNKSSKSYSSSSRSYRRSRSKSKNSSRHSRSTSKDRRRKRSHSREKYRRKNRYKSRSRSKGRSTKYSRSSSTDSKHSSSSGTSKSSSNVGGKKNTAASNSNLNSNPEELLREKLLKAIKAAESADHKLKEQGVLPKGVKSRNDLSNLTNNKPQSDVIRDINADEFVQKSFVSSRKHEKEDVKIPSPTIDLKTTDIDTNSIFHANFFIDPKVKLDRWIKKLYQIRQKALAGEPL